MSSMEIVNVVINLINFIFIGYLTFKITSSNEALVEIERNREEKNQPLICIWISDQSQTGLVELVIVNSGMKDLLLKNIMIEVPNQEVDYMYIEYEDKKPSLSGKMISDVVLRPGIIHKVCFKMKGLVGSYQFKFLLRSYESKVEIIQMDMSVAGPYYLSNKKIFHY